jgi:pimeloyl-ACP methyl ester carboxylesterase
MKQKILQMMFTLALCASAQGQSFSDDFNRPDSPSAGNGWLNAIDNRPGAQLGIVGNRLSAASMSSAAVYRPFPTANQVVLSAVITDQNGYYCGNFRLRYQVSFAVRNDGTMNGGYGIHFNRADQNYPSGVTLSDNGVNIASTNSSFQFGYSLTINYVVFNPDGSVQGRITGDGNTFDFSFPARTINSQGNNISINIPDGTACPNGIVSTVDNFQIAQVSPQAPNILVPPQSQSVQAGDDVTFTVSATGTFLLNYQWQFNPKNAFGGQAGWQDLPGETGATLTKSFVSSADAGLYSVRVWNIYGSILSAAAQLTVSQPLDLTQTSLTPTTDESTPAVLCPISASQLKMFANNGFTTATTLDSTKMTIVLTHGWIPSIGPIGLTAGINGWPLDFANKFVDKGIDANIVAWDWSCAAQSFLCDPSKAAGNTQPQGVGLAQALSAALGPNYTQPIHFIGHSLGTLVNATAANYLHAEGFDWSKTQMTLFDEASIATFTECPQMLWLATLGNPPSTQNYLQPLPKQFEWADNYVSLVGSLHADAVNVILTNGLPTEASGILDLIGKAAAFHSYPNSWYKQTIITDVSAMGDRWSFERGGFLGSPTLGTVFVQENNGSEWNLTQTSYSSGGDLLNKRYQTYHSAVRLAGAQTVEAGFGSGNVFGLSTWGAPTDGNIILYLITSIAGGPPSPQLSPHRVNRSSGNADVNIPAYAWIPLTVPSNTTYMSFDFSVDGNGKDDSFAVAMNGTNVFSVKLSLIQTDVALNSGLIDTSPYAGQQVEFFFGIVGGSSTDASVTVSNLQFFVAVPPALQAQANGANYVASWPLSAQNFNLQTTTNLADPNSWTTLPDVPAIVNLQNTITNPISDGARFYRLVK